MRYYVGGEEIPAHSDCSISELPDRLVVKSARGAETAVAVPLGDAVLVSFRGRQYRVERKRTRSGAHGVAASGELRAPMPGQIVDVVRKLGDDVTAGEKILVLEAMKTQQAFVAPFDGKLVRLEVAIGDQIADGALLAVVEAGAT